MWALFKLVLVGYILLVGLIYLFQRRLMYLPTRIIADPAACGLPQAQEIFVKSSDGTRIQLWHEAAKPGYPTVIYFHGNAGHIGERAAKFSSFAGQGFGFVAISYRGFGKSEGTPSETGI